MSHCFGSFPVAHSRRAASAFAATLAAAVLFFAPSTVAHAQPSAIFAASIYSVANQSSNGLSSPAGVAVDSSGNVYIADSANNRVLKETLSNGIYTQSVVASGGELSTPYGVAVDTSGNVYISSTGNHFVLLETPSGGSYTETVFPGIFNFSAAIAVDTSGNVYIANNTTVLKDTPTGNDINPYSQTVVSTDLGEATGVAVDASGNVYIADAANNQVLLETYSAGLYTQSVLVGSGLSSPTGVAVDSQGNVYISDSGNNRIIEEALSSGTYTENILANSGLSTPWGLAVDAVGDVYVADYGTSNLRELSRSSANFGSVNIGASSVNPVGVLFAFTTSLQLSSTTPYQVVTTGLPNLDFSDATASASGACSSTVTYNAGDTCFVKVSFAPLGVGSRLGAVNLFNTAGGLIATGYVTGVGVGPQITFSPGTLSTLPISTPSPLGVAVDAGNNVFVADSAAGKIYEAAYSAGSYTPYLLLQGIAANDIAVDGGGNLFVTISSSGVVAELTLSPTGYQVSNFLQNFGFPYGVAVDGSGNLYIADAGHGTAYKETPSSASATGYVQSTITSDLSQPVSIAVDALRNLYITDYVGGKVALETPNAGGSSYTESTLISVSQPYGVAVDSGGDVYVSSPTAPSVFEYTPQSGYTQTSVQGSPAYDLAVDSVGNLYRTATSGSVVKTDFADGPSVAFNSVIAGQLSSDSPRDVTVSNIGSTSLIFTPPFTLSSNFTLGAANADDCSVMGTLTTGQNCLLEIGFQPSVSASGAITGSLQLVDNNLNSTAPAAMQTLSLSGNAISAELTSPSNGSTLSGPTQFTWAASSSITHFQLKIGTTYGATNIYNGSSTTAHSVSVTIPANGATLYAELYYLSGGTWKTLYYTFTEAGTLVAPALMSPPPTTKLTGQSITFTWSSPSGPIEAELVLGTTGLGSNNVFTSAVTEGNSVKVNNIPANGATLYARLYYVYNGVWHSVDFTYTEFGTISLPVLQLPPVINGNSGTFTWTPGAGPIHYELDLGSTFGNTNLYKSGVINTTTTTVLSMPASGTKVYAQLFYEIDGTWKSTEYSYIEP